MNYVRIQATYNSKVTGKPCGIFGVMHGLLSRDELTPEESEIFIEIRTWFEINLKQPEFYDNGNVVHGITWFKETNREMIDRLLPLTKILVSHSIEYEYKIETNPGKIVYEDDCQIGTI